MNNVAFNSKDFNGPVLVTGAGGCIGSWVVALLIKAKIPLVAFDLSKETRRLKLLISDSEIKNIKWITGDIVDTKNINNVIRNNNICFGNLYNLSRIIYQKRHSRNKTG